MFGGGPGTPRRWLQEDLSGGFKGGWSTWSLTQENGSAVGMPVVAQGSDGNGKQWAGGRGKDRGGRRGLMAECKDKAAESDAPVELRVVLVSRKDVQIGWIPMRQ
eukprot:760302-Hanusia_phi.AAC.4